MIVKRMLNYLYEKCKSFLEIKSAEDIATVPRSQDLIVSRVN